MYNFIKHITLNEGHSPKTLKQDTLKFKRDALEPVISEDAVDTHYGKLYKGYVDRYNKGEGDPDFNEAGAWLHGIYFAQLAAPADVDTPHGAILEFIEKHHKTWKNFKEKFEIEAMKIQGSGWIYLARNGEIKTIKNHQIKQDIVLLIDWWEHAWFLDYQSDKKTYLRNHWKIIDWDVISSKVDPKS
jgi:Fe-Mn family superoxide dismutase